MSNWVKIQRLQVCYMQVGVCVRGVKQMIKSVSNHFKLNYQQLLLIIYITKFLFVYLKPCIMYYDVIISLKKVGLKLWQELNLF